MSKGEINDQAERYEERAAIMEYDGGLSRERAEAEAAYIIYGRLRERVVGADRKKKTD